MQDSNATVNIDVDLGHGHAPRELPPRNKFRIAFLGEFSGRASRKLPHQPNLAGRKPISVDPDNFEAVMQQLGVELHLGAGADPILLRFSELDHFHPDHLLAQVPLLRSLRQTRVELAKPPASPTRAASAPAPSRKGGDQPMSFLDQIADATEPQAPLTSPAADLFDQAIRSIAHRHTTPKADPRTQEIGTQIDNATTEALRTILSHPAFQNLEAAWRSVFFLLRHLETGVNLEISLIDISRAELFADLSTDNLESSGLSRLLVKEAADAPAPWSVIAGLYTFTPNERDCAALARLGMISASAGAPFIAAMDPRLFGCQSIAATPDPDDWNQPLAVADRQAWDRLRAASQAEWLGLAMPRFMLRLPYGRKTSPIDSFPFEEMPEPPDHDAYLWGNPGVAVACLIGQAYQRNGWQMRPGSINRLDDVPAHVHGHDDVTPPAEIWITECFAERMLDEGIMPLASVKHNEAVQLVRVQSIARPPKPLAGPWS